MERGIRITEKDIDDIPNSVQRVNADQNVAAKIRSVRKLQYKRMSYEERRNEGLLNISKKK